MKSSTKALKVKRLFFLQRGLCAYCGEPMVVTPRNSHPQQATLEHIRPRSAGGRHNWENLILVHKPCNVARGNGPCPPFVIDMAPLGGRIGWQQGWEE